MFTMVWIHRDILELAQTKKFDISEDHHCHGIGILYKYMRLNVIITSYKYISRCYKYKKKIIKFIKKK